MAIFHNEKREGEEESQPDSSTEQPNDSNDTSDPSEKPTTGDPENAVLWMLVLSISLVLLCVTKTIVKRKA